MNIEPVLAGSNEVFAGANNTGILKKLSVAILSYDATIGTGGDYAEPADAIAASKKRMKFLSNVSATKTTTCSGFTIIDTNGFTFTFTGQTFTLSAATRIYGTILGNLTISVDSCTLFDFTLTGNLVFTSDYNFSNLLRVSGTCTYNAGSDNNIMHGCRVASTFTNSGTNNEINNMINS